MSIRYSFVIPTYNNRELLRNTLESLNHVEKPAHAEFEVIVSDDGSDDNSEEFIWGVNRNYPIEYVYTPRDGKSSRARTRNRGIDRAKGEICVFIDSDIIVPADHLGQIERCFSYGNDMYVYGNRLMMVEPFPMEKIGKEPVRAGDYYSSDDPDVLEYRHLTMDKLSYNPNCDTYSWMQVYGCNLAVRRDRLRTIGGFDENFVMWGMEDQELGYRMRESGLQPVINSRMEVIHQYHGERNDLFIEDAKIEGFKQNIDYFVMKHPNAIQINRKFAYRFMTGQLPVMNTSTVKKTVEFTIGNETDDEVMKGVRELSYDAETEIIVHDPVEKSDIDILIQRMGRTSAMIRFFPSSKRLNPDAVSEMKRIIRAHGTGKDA